MRYLVPDTLIARVAKSWLRGPWMQAQIQTHLRTDEQFNPDEADDFAWYLLHALREAPTHGIPKMNEHLICTLGLPNRMVRPNAEIEWLEHPYGQHIVRWNTNRKFGPSVMRNFISEAVRLTEYHGLVFGAFYNAFHFGYGRLYGNLLAEAGLISILWGTALRGDEVFPYGADTIKPENRRMGTDPITITLPTRKFLGFNACLDAATSPISMGGLALLKTRGEPIPPGVVNDQGNFSTRPEDARWPCHVDHKMYAISLLLVEAFAALAGGGLPQERCVRHGDEPGAPSQWFALVINPDAVAYGAGNRLECMAEVLKQIVEDNGQARIPGAGELEHARRPVPVGMVALDPDVCAKFQEMAAQAALTLPPLKAVGQ